MTSAIRPSVVGGGRGGFHRLQTHASLILPAGWLLTYTCTTFSTSSKPNSKASMRIVTYSEARSSLKSVLDAVHDDADVTVISRRDGADAVVMSFDHYQSIMETMHLLSTPANAAHLAKSIAQHKAGKATRRDLSKA